MGRHVRGRPKGPKLVHPRQLLDKLVEVQDKKVHLETEERALDALKQRLSFIEGDQQFSADAPAVQESLQTQKNLPWDYQTNPDVPVKFDVPAVSDDELLAQAQKIVQGEQESPALKIARHLTRGPDQPRFETFAEVIVESAKKPTTHVFGFNYKAGKAIRKFRAFSEWIKGARRFALDDDFTTRAYELSLQPPTKLLDLSLIARSPGDRVWIEWDEQVRLRSRKLDKGSLPVGANQDQFNAMGFAITMLEDGTHVVEIVGLLPQGVALLPLAFAVEPSGTRTPSLHREVDLKLLNLLTQHMGQDASLATHGLAYGYVTHWVDNVPERDASRALLNKMRYCFSRASGWAVYSDENVLSEMATLKKAHDFLMATEGDYRYLLAVLALMSSTYTEMDRIERQDKNTGQAPYRHQKNFLTFSKVLLRLPKDQPFKVVLRDLGKSVIAHKKRHAVLPHWRERRKTRFNGCEHQMVALSAQRLQCSKCGHLKWYVRDHERGDASLGYVHKDYVVTASRQTI